jgi:hypothetical protein
MVGNLVEKNYAKYKSEMWWNSHPSARLKAGYAGPLVVEQVEIFCEERGDILNRGVHSL